MTQNKWRGTGVALITPFTKNNKVDYTGLEKLIEHCIHGRVEYLVPLGTTGESATLTKEEKAEVLDFVIEKNAGRLPIVAGFGGNSTQSVIDNINLYQFKG